jgi:hypothetical protein
MSSDTDAPRQRTVAELLAAHGDAAVTGRRARRRAAEDAAGTGQAVVDADGPDPASYRNGSTGSHPVPVVNGPGVNDTVGNGAVANGPMANGTADPYGAPYSNGTGTGGLPTRPGEAYGAPYTNGAAETGYNAPPPRPRDNTYGAPYVNGGDTVNGDPYPNRGGAPDARPDSRTAWRGAGPPDDIAHPTDSDAAFVNGGAVYPDTEATAYRGGTPWNADRSVLREPVLREPVPREMDAPVNGQNGAPARRGPEAWAPPSADKARARPTEQMPRLRSDRTPMLDPGLTGPIDVQRLPRADVADEGPPTAVGMAPAGAEGYHRERTSRRRKRGDGGPPTAAAAPILDDDDDDEDDLPAGLGDEPRRRGTSPVVGQSTGQAWAAVVAQWIAGAIGGAALWVGFRFLWRDLPVVALAAAALVTVGLVLVVRALMRNDDRRTTLFAVLVGLLLTVSPAILVLLGR